MSDRHQRTEWFLKAYVQPAHAGWYEVSEFSQLTGRHLYAYFDGSRWVNCAHKLPDARGTVLVDNQIAHIGTAFNRWRGLARNPR